MTERYLFRGKTLGDGVWVYGSYVEKNGYHFIIVPQSGEWLFGADSYWEVNPDTIGQCTGLRDKNGALIFEGDKLIDDSGIWWEVHYYDECGCLLAYSQTLGDAEPVGDLSGCEVIGNIHDKEAAG